MYPPATDPESQPTFQTPPPRVPAEGPPPIYYGPPPSYEPPTYPGANVYGSPPGAPRPYNYLPQPPPQNKKIWLALIPVAVVAILIAVVIGATSSSSSSTTSPAATQNVTPYDSTSDTSSCTYWTGQVRAINPAAFDDWSTSDLVTAAHIVVAHSSCFNSDLVDSSQRLLSAADSTTY
jgi:hypothetical protein